MACSSAMVSLSGRNSVSEMDVPDQAVLVSCSAEKSMPRGTSE